MYYFASDIHLVFGEDDAHDREKKVVRWLKQVSVDAKAIFLVGDIFDFWFEYKRAVPKGFVRLLGTIAELTDKGIEVHFFAGNHDMWLLDYFEKECGMIVHRNELRVELYNKKYLIRHGDGLGKMTAIVKFMNFMFKNSIVQRMFASIIHPNIALKFGQDWSKSSRGKKPTPGLFCGEDEALVSYSRRVLNDEKVDCFVYGHRHSAEIFKITDDTDVIFLGDWLNRAVYVEVGEQGVKMKNFEG